MCVISIETGEKGSCRGSLARVPQTAVSSKPVSNLVSKDKVDGPEEGHFGLHLPPPQSLDKLKRS